ncbi:MAG: HlyD family efflux transporter periplasmic adaptor subunit, partial [Candidatus Dormibacteraeota bacterium]|nr:HlyD family efflux transporter periplasmic adaptor subunit [Candidatus Dormibacteraeota bacterium]
MIAGCVLVVGAAGGVALAMRSRSTPSVQYRTVAAVNGTVSQKLGMVGQVVPANETAVNFQASGVVNAVDVQPGQQVAAGATLATVDPSSLQASLAQAQANLDSAEAKLSNDQAQTNPNATTIQQDEDQVTIAQVNVNQDQAQVNEATLTAPVAGTVLEVNTYPGEKVSGSGGSGTSGSTGSSASGGASSASSGSGGSAAGSSGSSGGSTGSSGGSPSGSTSGSASQSGGSSTNNFVLMQPGAWNVVGTVSDAQINQIATGQNAQVTPAGATQALLGKVVAIAPEATVSSGVSTFPVTVQITNPLGTLKPQESAQVSIIVNQAVGVLTVPTSAVHTTGSGTTTVELMSGQTPHATSVQVGASDATNTQILSGLQPGDRVVLATVTGQVPANGGAGGGLGGRGGFGGGGLGGGARGGA